MTIELQQNYKPKITISSKKLETIQTKTRNSLKLLLFRRNLM